MSVDKFRIVTGPIRAGAVPVHVYNDGLSVFLFDESNTEVIRKQNPEVVWSIGEQTFEEPKTRALIESGDLVVYGLSGDGGVDLEVVVGKPLDEQELSTGRWAAPQQTLLRLPSGRLCVHSYNSLPMGDNGEDSEEEGALVVVPAGDYILTAHRKDWDAMETEGVVSLDDADEAGIDVYEDGRIDEVIVLTPIADTAPLENAPSGLFLECFGI